MTSQKRAHASLNQSDKTFIKQMRKDRARISLDTRKSIETGARGGHVLYAYQAEAMAKALGIGLYEQSPNSKATVKDSL